MSDQPVIFQWDGEVMVPAGKAWMRRANERYVVGQRYQLTERLERSSASHQHLFAVLREAWLSLPDQLAAQFETPEHLRKWCLCKAGFADKRSIHASSVAEARKVAAFVRPMDSYAIVTTTENVITIWTAQSMDHRSMDRARFQEAKDGVLRVLGDLIDVAPATLEKQGADL